MNGAYVGISQHKSIHSSL